jgi:hypothetical protein
MRILPTGTTSPDIRLLTCQHMVYYFWEHHIKVQKAPAWPNCFSISYRLLSKQMMLLSSISRKIQRPFSYSCLGIYRSVHNSIPSFFTSRTPHLSSAESNSWWVSALFATKPSSFCDRLFQSLLLLFQVQLTSNQFQSTRTT